MTEIVELIEIIILATCSVYVAFRVAKAITQNKPKEPEKETLCDTCKHLVRKGGDIEPGKYKCGFENESFRKAPEYCRNYEQREEKKEPPEVNADESL